MWSNIIANNQIIIIKVSSFAQKVTLLQLKNELYTNQIYKLWTKVKVKAVKKK